MMQTNSVNNTLGYIQVTILVIIVLYFGSGLFIPLCYGLLLAIVLYPLCKWLENKGIRKIVAITVCLTVVLTLFVALVIILFMQLEAFREDLPVLIDKFKGAAIDTRNWLQANTGVSMPAFEKWWRSAIQYAENHAGSIVATVLVITTETFVMLFLIPVFTVLFLYNRTSFVTFLTNIVPQPYKTYLPEILEKVIKTYAHFVKGTAIVYLIVGTLNSIGLLALGVPHAILFGMLTAIMTIIPYIGIIISALLPISVAWITKDSMLYPIGVIAVFAFVQYLEANIIFPKVVGTQLDISTWAVLVAIIAGGILWGVSGMILFIPFLGVARIVFDHFPHFRVFNVLLAKHSI